MPAKLCVSISLTESSEEAPWSFAVTCAWGCPCLHQAHPGPTATLVSAPKVQDALGRARCSLDSSSTAFGRLEWKEKGPHFPWISCLQSPTREVENLGPFFSSVRGCLKSPSPPPSLALLPWPFHWNSCYIQPQTTWKTLDFYSNLQCVWDKKSPTFLPSELSGFH